MRFEVRNLKSEPGPKFKVQRMVVCSEVRLRNAIGFRISDLGPSSRGFTLIEVLIAVAIFALVLTSIHAVFYSAIKLRNKTTDTIEAGLPLQQTLAILRRDLASLMPPGGTLSGQLQTALLSGSGIAVDSQSSPDFYTASAALDESLPWAEVQRVSYHLQPSTNNTPGLDLYRAVTRNLLPVAADQPESVAADQPEYQWLMGGVQTIAFSYYDGSTWRDSWDSTNGLTAPLPNAIKVQIQLEPGLEQRSQIAPVELVVPLMTQSRSNQTAQAASGGGA